MAKHGPMYDSLAGLRNRVRPTEVRKQQYNGIKDPSPSPLEWKGDGEDHINIWIEGQTTLGQYLALDSDLPFTHKYFGRFQSVECFWFYIQSQERDDRLRSMRGQTLKTFSRKLTRHRVTNFQAIIADTMYQRVMAYKKLQDAIRESTLPFDYYYVERSGEIHLPVRPNFFKWIVAAVNEIRKALQGNREPNFSFLMDIKNVNIYKFVLPESVFRKEPVAGAEAVATEVADKPKLVLTPEDMTEIIPAVKAEEVVSEETKEDHNLSGFEKVLVEEKQDQVV